MQSKQEDKMSREEIIKYVDDLIKANKRAYDKRLSPLLYDFFLRANEKFEWSRDEFLKKYQNFKSNVKVLRFYNFDKLRETSLDTPGCFVQNLKNREDGIYINENIIEIIRNKPTNELINIYIIDNLFHESLHATDLLSDDGKVINNGLCGTFERNKENEEDMMLNEYANVLSAGLISSDKTIYMENFEFVYSYPMKISGEFISSYLDLKIAGKIMCLALDITEPQLAKLKDKGRNVFYEYLQNKFSYMDIEATLDAFKSSLNVIYNASTNNDKENISLGFKNMLDAANNLIANRIDNVLKQVKDRRETLERIYYDIKKIHCVIKNAERIYQLEENNEIEDVSHLKTYISLLDKIMICNSFLDTEELFTQEEKETIQNSSNVRELIISKFNDNYVNSTEYDIEEIERKYYPKSSEPLNDNTKLIEQIKRIILKPTIQERIQKGEKTEDIESQEQITANRLKSANFKNSVKYETPIIHNTSTKKEQQKDTSRGNEEGTR